MLRRVCNLTVNSLLSTQWLDNSNISTCLHVIIPFIYFTASNMIVQSPLCVSSSVTLVYNAGHCREELEIKFNENTRRFEMHPTKNGEQ